LRDEGTLVGSAEDYERLVDQYSRVMSAAIRRVCGRRSNLIPDVELEVRLALWKRLRDGKNIEHPVSYLYKMALTTALAVLRKQPSEASRVGIESLDRGTSGSGGSRALHPLERARLLEQLLGRLPPDRARALRAYLAGFTHGEVAALYGWTEAIARHHIYRGLAALRAEGEGRSEDA
jgi:RNA polymerase sigma-70 factor (ECF subfamily)